MGRQLADGAVDPLGAPWSRDVGTRRQGNAQAPDVEALERRIARHPNTRFIAHGAYFADENQLLEIGRAHV